MKHLLTSIVFAAGLIGTSQAQTTILSETFNSGIPNNWTVVIDDTSTVDSLVIAFEDGWVTLVDPVDSTDTIVGSTSFFTEPAEASRWLITPPLALGAYGNVLKWQGRVHDPSYADGYKVLISTTDNQLASFTDTLRLIAEESEDWLEREINLSDSGYVSQTIYIAFVNNSYDKFKLYLDDFSVRIEDPLSTKESIAMDWEVYPNPTSEFITIQTQAAIENISIYSLSGQKQAVEINSNNQLNIKSLANGVYLLNITTSTGTATKRFIKK